MFWLCVCVYVLEGLCVRMYVCPASCYVSVRVHWNEVEACSRAGVANLPITGVFRFYFWRATVREAEVLQ